MSQLEIQILTMEGVKFAGTAKFVTVPGADGELTILPSHAALLTAIGAGEVTVHNDKDEQYISVAGGVMEVADDKISILADAAERDSEIDLARAEAALKRAQDQIASRESATSLEETIRALARARSRIKVAKHKKRGQTPSSNGDSLN